jgi:hypothetical protein
MSQAGVSARSGRVRRVDTWFDGSEPDMFRDRAAREPHEPGQRTPAPVAAARVRPAPVSGARGRPAPAPAASRQAAAAAAPEPPAPAAPGRIAGRRTVTITGHGTERNLPPARPRPQRRPHERAGFRPDRVGLWAVLLCVVLLLVAATSSRAATAGPGSVRTAVAHPDGVAPARAR